MAVAEPKGKLKRGQTPSLQGKVNVNRTGVVEAFTSQRSNVASTASECAKATSSSSSKAIYQIRPFSSLDKPTFWLDSNGCKFLMLMTTP